MRPLVIVSIVALLLTGCASFREGYWQGRWETCIKQAQAQRLAFVHPYSVCGPSPQAMREAEGG